MDVLHAAPQVCCHCCHLAAGSLQPLVNLRSAAVNTIDALNSQAIAPQPQQWHPGGKNTQLVHLRSAAVKFINMVPFISAAVP
jgi:hypothetical protein